MELFLAAFWTVLDPRLLGAVAGMVTLVFVFMAIAVIFHLIYIWCKMRDTK